MSYIIGVDAGGTKTSAISYCENGIKKNKTTKGPGNVTVNFNGAMAEIQRAIQDIINIENTQPESIVVGIAGVTESLKVKVYDTLKHQYQCDVFIESDYALAYHSVFDKNGILIVAGTGVVMLGKHNGQEIKLGGWGHILGDEGSGYEIVIRSLKRAIAYLEEFEKVPHVIALLMKEMECSSFDEMKQYVYAHEKSTIASYAPIIINQAKNGDSFAFEITKETVDFLVNKCSILLTRLNVTDKIPLATMGGVLNEESYVRELFIKEINMKGLPVQLYNLSEPNRGAVYFYKDKLIKDKKYAVGLMSGTSLDGIDTALCEVSGINDKTKIRLIDFESYPFPSDVLDELKSIVKGEKVLISSISRLNAQLGSIFSDAVIDICNKNKIETHQLKFIASHGQTIFHEASSHEDVKSTLQIGEASIIAFQTKATVISNFRFKDIAAGGEGAPLVPKTELILYSDYKDSVLLNVGGISNITYIPSSDSASILGYDTGPGNMMIDEAMTYLYKKPYDKDGEVASRGKIIKELFYKLMDHWFIHQSPPKSTGRDEFGQSYTLRLIREYKSYPPEDIVCTFTFFTAKSIVKHVLDINDNQGPVKQLIIGGGGSYNKKLVAFLSEELQQVDIKVLRQEQIGCSSEAKEAIAFVVLGNQALHRQPGNVPSVTGAKQEVICGSVTWPN